MRAALLPDPHRGPGYSIIEIHGAPPLAAPVFLLRRASDGAWLSGSGWGKEETSLTPDNWESGEDAQRLMLGPGIVDDLEAGDDYTLTIPGAGSCALILAGLDQSRVIGGVAVGVTPPPVPGFTLTGPDSPAPDAETAIDEGVEPTPEVLAGAAGGLPSGVAAYPENEAEASRRKRPGCALLGVLLLATGLAGALALC